MLLYNNQGLSHNLLNLIIMNKLYVKFKIFYLNEDEIIVINIKWSFNLY